MPKARPHRVGVACLLAFALWSAAASAQEGDQLLATVDKPARITATRTAPAVDAAPARPMRVIVSVTHYRPTEDGSPLEVVVNGRSGDGAEQEIGRFGITPDREFASADPSTTQRFRFALPRELAAMAAAGKPLTFSVQLVPVHGKGQGAFLRLGALEFG
jgi:hypothetical protein